MQRKLMLEFRGDGQTIKRKYEFKECMMDSKIHTIRDGRYTSFYPNGDVREKKRYREGKLNGRHIKYTKYEGDDDGYTYVMIQAHYFDDVLDGVWKRYYIWHDGTKYLV